MAILYYVPWWKRAKLGGPWVVRAWLGDGWECCSYMPTFRVAWFHLLVSFGLRDYA